MKVMEELLRKLGISSNQSSKAIAEALGAKQMEYLERLDNVEDEARREQLQAELKQIEEAIVEVSNGAWQGVTGMKRDTATQESFEDLKQQEIPKEKETLQAESDASPDLIEYERVNDIYEADVAKGFPLMKELAEKGNMFAQFNMGAHYDFGENCERDVEEAIRWYEKAAENGHMAAMFNLANCYYRGEGVEVDMEKVIELYEKSAEAGCDDAYINLGIIFITGDGEPEERKRKAIEYWKKAAYAKNKNAIIKLSTFGVKP